MENKASTLTTGGTDRAATAGSHKREEALREYYHAQELIDRFDERSLKIKSWSVTSCGVALGFGVTESQPLLFVVAAIGSIVFWYLEVLWKVMQGMMIEHSNALEALLAEPTLSYGAPKIGHTFTRGFKGADYWTRFRKTARFPNVCMPHILIFFLGWVLFIGALLGFKL